MYRIITNNKLLPLKERLKRLISYFLVRRGAHILWKRRFNRVFDLYPDFNKPCEKIVEKAHKEYWKPFGRSLNMATLRLCSSISGVSDPKYIPEEIFVSDIEPTLNQTNTVEYLTYKSFYNHWFTGNIFPRDYFHNVDGEWLDKDLNPVSFSDIESISGKLTYPVVVKPSRDSYGGQNVYFPGNKNELVEIIKDKKNFLVQERIIQDSFYEQFNKSGINTLRVNIYRSVKDNELHIVNVVLRMGVGGSLDNETAGGIVTMIRKDGTMNGFAVDKYGKKYMEHPDTGASFSQKIPDFENLKKTALKIASKIFYARLICLDLCYDSERKWRMIEVNINGSTIRFAQYHGSLFFGEYTDEVYYYCLNNHWTLK